MVKISQHAFDQIQFIKYHKKEQNESLNQFKEKQLNSANTEQLGQYRKPYWPSFCVFAEFLIGMMWADLSIQILYGPRQANLVLIAYASSEGSGEPAHPRSLARTFAARSYKQ